MMAMPHCESVPLFKQSLDRNLIDKKTPQKTHTQNKILKNICLKVYDHKQVTLYSVTLSGSSLLILDPRSALIIANIKDVRVI